jgi:hypothetical protein
MRERETTDTWDHTALVNGLVDQVHGSGLLGNMNRFWIYDLIFSKSIERRLNREK